MWTAKQLFDGEQLGLERDPGEVTETEEETFLDDEELEDDDAEDGDFDDADDTEEE